jgi:Ras family protein
LPLSQICNRCILYAFAIDPVDDEYIATIGDCYYKKERIGSELYNVRIQDTSGDEEFSSLLPEVIATSDLFVFLYDVTDGKSLMEVESLYDIVVKTKGSNAFSSVLVGSKKDLSHDRQIPETMGATFASLHNCQYMEITSKNRDESTGVFRGLLYLHDEKYRQKPSTPRKRTQSLFACIDDQEM